MADISLPPFLRLEAALREFVTVTGTQAQQHIRPIHRHVALRLVIEGGFHPDEITPHPPLRVTGRGGGSLLHLDHGVENDSEKTLRQAGEFDTVVGYTPRIA